MKRTLLNYAEKLKKPLHIFTAFAVIVCTAFVFPVLSFAATDYNENCLVPPLGNIGVSGIQQNGLKFTVDGVGYCTSNTSDIVYGVFVNNGFGFISHSVFTIYYKQGNGQINGYTVSSEDSNGLYTALNFGSVSSSDTKNPDIPVFTSNQDAINAFLNYTPVIENVYDFETSVEVPSGSVAYIGIPSSGSLSLSAKTEMPMYTSIGSNTWSNIPQRVKQVSSLPDSNTTFPLTGSAIPNWTKTEPYNWLNQSKSAVTSNTTWSGSNGNFLTFYNPVYYMDGSIQASTNTVYLTISGYSSIRVYPLQNDMSITTGSTSTSPSGYDGYWDAIITDNGDGTGNVSFNPSEGSNLPPTPTSNQYNTGTSSSIIDYINQINQTLTNFAESFINLLKAPVAHIQQLVAAGSDFVGQLSSLYSWLPTEVYNTLTSAIILCISVGVLKVLL